MLIPVGIEKLILFGSYASGSPTDDSDLDLLVVTDDKEMPSDFREKSKIYLKIATAIESVRRRMPVDLIVHTQPMHQKFIEIDSLFSREIQTDGKVLYEKNHASMA